MGLGLYSSPLTSSVQSNNIAIHAFVIFRTENSTDGSRTRTANCQNFASFVFERANGEGKMWSTVTISGLVDKYRFKHTIQKAVCSAFDPDAIKYSHILNCDQMDCSENLIRSYLLDLYPHLCAMQSSFRTTTTASFSPGVIGLHHLLLPFEISTHFFPGRERGVKSVKSI
jgi:hypothetical protein